MTIQKERDVDVLVNEIKKRILEYYKEYEMCIDKQLEDFDVIIDKLTKLNKSRIEDVNETEHNVITIVSEDTPVGSKIEQIKNRFKKVYTKMNDDYETLLKLSNFDHLTQIFNRRQFDVQIKEACSKIRGCHLLMIDIDDFKRFNDDYGHLIGDQALKLVASIIKKICTRNENNFLPFRYGGEEFAVILPETPKDKTLEVAEFIRKAISEHPFMIKDDKGYIKHQDIKITISVGVTEIITEDTPETCISRADKAMYRAKKTGKNKVCLYDEQLDKE